MEKTKKKRERGLGENEENVKKIYFGEGERKRLDI